MKLWHTVFDDTTHVGWLQLGKLYLDHGLYARLAVLVRSLEQTCQNPDGTDDQKKANQLFEIFSLKFPMLTAQKNTKELKKE